MTNIISDVRIDEKVDVEKLHQKFSEYGANAKEWMKKCVLLLPEIDRKRVWARKGFSSIYEYAAKLAGMSRDKVNEALRVLSKVEDKPALVAIIQDKGLGAVKPVATIATKATEEFWAKKARELSKHELEAYVRGVKNQMNNDGTFGRPGTATGYETLTDLGKPCDLVKGEKLQVFVSMELDFEVLDELKKLKGDGDWNALMKGFLALRKEKLEEIKPEAKENASRYVPAVIRKYVLAKYNSRCAFPGCNRRYAELHHVGRFFFDDRHDPDGIVPLCESHHMLAHRGLIENENELPKNWRIRAEADSNIADSMMMVRKERAVRV